jgi:hypothetical protein
VRKWDVIKSSFLLLSLFLLVSCTSEEQEAKKPYIGIPSSAPFDQSNLDSSGAWLPFQDENKVISQLINKELDFAYVSLPNAVRHYIKGEPIVAVAGCSFQNDKIWLLATRTDLTRNDRSMVETHVRQFYTMSQRVSCAPIGLEEQEILKAIKNTPILKGSNKVNITWLIDRSFKRR